MKLSELLAYDNIVIQCHDNPDADTIACGFGVYLYLKSKGKEPRLIYGGQNVIRKTNLVMLIRDLKIPIEHVDYLHKPDTIKSIYPLRFRPLRHGSRRGRPSDPHPSARGSCQRFWQCCASLKPGFCSWRISCEGRYPHFITPR